MAKIKKEEKLEKSSTIEIDDIIIKEFGKVIVSAETIKQTNYKIIPTTPKIDIALGGGISEGTLTILSASPKHGKTCLALQIARNALAIDSDFGQREVYYLNIESRIKERDLNGIKGLDASKIKIIKSTAGNILSGEDFLKIGEKIINAKPGAVIIFDSFSALCSKERSESDLADRFRDTIPQSIASFIRRIAPVISINKSIILGINHMYANTSGKGNKTWLESSGQKIQYGLDQKLMGAYTKPWIDLQGNQIGLEVFWKVVTTYLSGGKLGEINTFLKFGEGYSDIQEYIDLATDVGIIDKKGAGWFTYKDIKLQGMDKLRIKLEEDPNLFAELKAEVDTIFKPKHDII